MAEDHHPEDQFSFHDYTIASSFERFVASLESCLTTWRNRELARHSSAQQHNAVSCHHAPLKLDAQLQHRLPFRTEQYTLALHLPPSPAPQQQAAGVHGSEATCKGDGSDSRAINSRQGVSDAWYRSGALAPIVSCLELNDAPHRLHQWFGAPAFLLLTPDSYSGRVLDEEEVHTLLSAAAVALSHARISWPLLVPVHDAVRDGYRGVAVAPASMRCATFQFDTDSLHSSRLPPRLLRLDQQLLLFARRLAAAAAPAAAAACQAALAAADLDAPPASMAADAAAAGASLTAGVGVLAAGGAALQVAVAVRQSYALPAAWDNSDSGDGSSCADEPSNSSSVAGEWDECALWRPWAAQADPIGCLELDVVWRFPTAAAALRAQPGTEAAWGAFTPAGVPAQAAEWRLLALSTSYVRDNGHRGFVLRPVEKPRRFLELQSIAGENAQLIQLGHVEVAPTSLPGDSSFFGMLLKLSDSCRWAARAPSLGSLASADWWLQQGSYLPPAPPDWVMKEAIRDIFQLPARPAWPGTSSATVAWPTSTAGQLGCLGKAAPLGALISRFALHALALGGPRAVAELWSRFVGTLRQLFWEQQRPLPRMPSEQSQQQAPSRRGARESSFSEGSPGSIGSVTSNDDTEPDAPSLHLSLLHQKLQMLNLCIFWQLRQTDQEQQQRTQQQAALGDDGHMVSGSPRSTTSTSSSYFSAVLDGDAQSSPSDLQQMKTLASLQDHGGQPYLVSRGPQPEGVAGRDFKHPEGVAGPLPGATLHLHADLPLQVPAVLEPPPQTEDMVAERQMAMQCMTSPGMDNQLQSRMLLSDMQAFKAANPGCCLLDFVRWHSPKDCCQLADGGWELSGRMAAEGNTWQQLWEAAAPVPAAAQPPLFDAELEGERVLHFLETLPPPVLFAELLCIGFSAAIQLLGVTGQVAELAPVRQQLDCLLAMARTALRDGVAAVGCGTVQDPLSEKQQPGGSSNEQSGTPLHQLPSWLQGIYSSGLTSSRYRRLLLLLGCTEQVVVAAYSLMTRLGLPSGSTAGQGQPVETSQQAGNHAVQIAAVATEGLIAAALGQQQQQSGKSSDDVEAHQCLNELPGAAAASAPTTCVELPQPLRQQVEELLAQSPEWEGSEFRSGTGSDDGRRQGHWPEPFMREWLLEVQGTSSSSSGSAGNELGGSNGAVLHRMYVKALQSEIRIATALSCELCK